MTRRRGGVALAASLIFALVLFPATAGATAVSSTQLQALAHSATAGDPLALHDLRAVTSVDGRPAALGAVLAASSPAALNVRLQALAGSGRTAAPDAQAAQNEAAAILDQSRYAAAPVPDPLQSALGALGRFIGRVARATPGGPVAFWVLAALLVLIGALAGARRMMHGLDASAAALAAGGVGPAAVDPAALEREAEHAEEGGAFATAVRLRFRAGLLRLGARHEIDYRPSLLTADIARRLRSPQFDALARSFERVAYGGVDANADDVTAARDGWRALLAREPRR
jgi:uncharacterized protein DUF4129